MIAIVPRSCVFDNFPYYIYVLSGRIIQHSAEDLQSEKESLYFIWDILKHCIIWEIAFRKG